MDDDPPNRWMRYVVEFNEPTGADRRRGPFVGDHYLELVYGPEVGARAVLLLRYLHASFPMKPTALYTLDELAAAAGSRPRQIRGPLQRLHRHHLIRMTPRRPVKASLEGDLATIELRSRLPLLPQQLVDRLPPLAASVARQWQRH